MQARELPKLFVKRLTHQAIMPKKGSLKAAGYDLFSVENKTVPGQGKSLIKIGISIKIPDEHYARIAPRSGLALKNHIGVGAGVIDQDYRGQVCVVLFNHGKQDFEVKKGDRIAQLIIQKFSYTEVLQVQNLDETQRGEGGFGSTGVQKVLQQKK